MKLYLLTFCITMLYGCKPKERLEDIAFNLNGVKLGATRADVMRTVPGFGDSRIVNGCLVYRGGWKFDVEYADELIFCFANGRLAMARADFRSVPKRIYDSLYAHLTEKYGSPKEQDSTSATWESPAAGLAINYVDRYAYMGQTMIIKDTTLLTSSK